MNKIELLQTYQNQAYQVMQSAFCNGQLSHAYLFYGNQGAYKNEMATLFAENLFHDMQQFCVYDDDISRRIQEHTYLDYIYLDGSAQTITKDAVDEIQFQFSSTAKESGKNKLYVINMFENTTIGAMNSLLKFLEEPATDTYAILIVENIERILPTIVSRCILVPFHPLAKQHCLSIALQQGLDKEDAYLLSSIFQKDIEYSQLIGKIAYQKAKAMLQSWMNDPYMFLVRYHGKLKTSYPIEDKSDTQEVCIMFFEMIKQLAMDCVKQEKVGISWYDEYIQEQDEQSKWIKMIEIAVNQKDKCNKTNDLNLVIEQGIFAFENINLEGEIYE